MTKHLRKYFSSAFPDRQYSAHSGQVLDVILPFGLTLNCVAGIISLVLDREYRSPLDMATIGSIFLINLYAYALHRRKHTQTSAIFLVFSLGGVITLVGLVSAGSFRIPLIGYIIVILMASLLLSRKAGFIAFILSIISSTIIIYLKEAGIFKTSPALNQTISTWIVTAMIFFWALYLVYISDREIRRAMYKAIEDETKLATSFEELNKVRSSLEVYSRDLEKRIVQLQVAADIASDAATQLEVDTLLDRAVNLIRERFGYYHAGIFMLDDRGEYAVLKAASGETGRIMVQGGHKLKVGEVGIVGHVAGSGRPRIASDVDSDEVYFRNPLLQDTHSELALPLKRGQQVIGVLDVQSQESGGFNQDDVTILQTMSDQLTTAILNAHLFEATRQQVEELTALHTVATAGAEATSEDELLERATLLIAEVFFPDNFGVLLVNDKTGLLHYHSSYRQRGDIPLEPMPIGKSLVGMSVSHGRSYRIPDVSKSPYYYPSDPLTQSKLCVPIKVDENVLGVINAESRLLAHFDADDERLLSTFAVQLGLAIKKVRLLEAERQRSAELEALRIASLHLTSNLDLDRLFEVLLEQAIIISSAQTAHLFLFDGEKLEFTAGSWAENSPKDLYAVPHPNGLTYQVAKTGQPKVITDARQHPIFANRAWDGAVASIPICTGQQVLGVMNLAYRGGPHIVDEEVLQALELLADQAAIAIINANLYTQIQERAQQLSEALQQREELDRLKNEFIQNVSHELRTPLAITRGYVDLLHAGELGPLNTEQRDAIHILSRRITFLTKLVDDLLLILEAESQDLMQEEIILNEVIAASVKDFHAAALKADLRLQAVLPEESIMVIGNYAHLDRLMDNLIGNAIKFTPKEGTVTVILERSNNEAVIKVVDTGIGISSDKVEHIFERFYQVDGSTKRRFGGIGLGLSLAREIALAHGGVISVDSQPGKGSTFSVRLPCLMKT